MNHADAADEDVEPLVRIGADHPLLAPPARIAPPLLVSGPILLNTHQLSWEAVEQLVAWLARRVDGHQEAWLYGSRGQRQHGIDVVGVTGTDAAVYQAKNLQNFTVRDLKNAVAKYASGERPFDARRLVIVTTADANRTKISEKLVELRAAHRDLIIELWNRQKLSELLYHHPDIVTKFFGAATTAVFCPAPEPTVLRPQPQEEPDAQALLRGPVAHLGLAAELAEADAARAHAPAAAAMAYGRIAEQLEETLYAPHALSLRRQQSAALHAAGHHDAGVRVDLALMAADLADGRAFHARSVIVQLADGQVEADDALVRTVNTLGALAEFEFEHTVTLDDVAGYLDHVQSSDPSALETATFFAEHAIAARRTALVRERAPALEAIAGAAEPSPSGLLDTARLRACLADTDPTGAAWQRLTRTARRDYPTAVTALLMARHARYLASADQGEDAVERYYDAVEHALAARKHEDASEWLGAQRLVRSRSNLALQERARTQQDLQFAVVLRTTGRDSVLPMPGDTRAQALAQLAKRAYPDARQALLQYRRRAVALGNCANEQEAQQLLARLYAQVGEPVEAMHHLVASGIWNPRREASEIAELFPERPLEWLPPQDLAARPPWERSCAFTVTAAAADLLSDTAAIPWIDAALHELDVSQQHTDNFARPAVDAMGCLAQLASACTRPQADRLIQLAGPSATATAVRVRDHASAFVQLARQHPTLGPTLVRELCRAFPVQAEVAAVVLAQGSAVLQRHPEVVSQECAGAAVGNLNAARALVLAGADTVVIRESVRQRMEALMALPREQRQIGTDEYALAELACAVLEPPELVPLADACAAQVRDHSRSSDRRKTALSVLGMLADRLDAHQCAQYFPLAAAAARGELDGSSDDAPPLPRHPLDRIRFNLSPTTLRHRGLRAAAHLATDDAHTTEIVTLAWQQLPHADDREACHIADALNRLGSQHPLLDPRAFAGHGHPWIRALAAARWSQHPDTHPHLGQLLAQDPHRRVRASLAGCLPDDQTALLNQLRRDPRRSVRNAAQRLTDPD